MCGYTAYSTRPTLTFILYISTPLSFCQSSTVTTCCCRNVATPNLDNLSCIVYCICACTTPNYCLEDHGNTSGTKDIYGMHPLPSGWLNKAQLDLVSLKLKPLRRHQVAQPHYQWPMAHWCACKSTRTNAAPSALQRRT